MTHTLEEARQYELIWLIARAQRLLGISWRRMAKGNRLNKTSSRTTYFRKSGMRLEYARTLQSYAVVLIQGGSEGDKRYQKGLTYLKESFHVFKECKAAIDVHMVEHIINTSEQGAMK